MNQVSTKITKRFDQKLYPLDILHTQLFIIAAFLFIKINVGSLNSKAIFMRFYLLSDVQCYLRI